MKGILTILAMIIFILAKSQVGINEKMPKATLDVAASPTDMTKVDGLIPPRIAGNDLKSKDALYTIEQKGTIVYTETPVTSPSTKTGNITNEGYYYFDGTLWQKLQINPDVKTDSNHNHISEDAGLGGIGAVPNTSSDNIMIGEKAGNTLSEGHRNVLLGLNAGTTINDDSDNIMIGYDAGKFLEQGGGNIMIGKFAGRNASPYGTTLISNSIAIGTQAGMEIGRGNNVFIGYDAGRKAQADALTIVGASAGSNLTTGRLNTFMGTGSGNQTTEGQQNTFYGNQSGLQNQTGNSNTFVGMRAGRQSKGNNNTLIGHYAGDVLTAGDYNVFIGKSANPNISATESYQLNIGNWIFGHRGNLGFNYRNPVTSTQRVNGLYVFSTVSGTGNRHVELLLNYRGTSSGIGGVITAQDSRIGDADKRVAQILLSKQSNATTMVDGRMIFKVANSGTMTNIAHLNKKGFGINAQPNNAAFHVIKNVDDLTPAIIEDCPTYADNASATAAGLPVGGIYKTATGSLMIVY